MLSDREVFFLCSHSDNPKLPVTALFAGGVTPHGL
jgi:hypothetical protein